MNRATARQSRRRWPPTPFLLAGSLLAAGTALAATPALESLFPRQADLYVEEGRLSRLMLPAEVLAACRPDLSDLRILSADGREVPFLVDSGLPEEAEVVRTATPEVLAVDRQRTGREDLPDLTRETFELPLPPDDPPGRLWDLVAVTPHRRFVRRAQVTLRRSAGDEEVLVGDASLFRLPDPPRERDRLTLPALPAEATGTLIVRLDGEEGFYLEPVLRFESSRRVASEERASVELRVQDVRQVDRRTSIELERPRGLVPDLLQLDTATTSFHRRVEVWDEGPGSDPERLGAATLYRLAAPVEADELEVPLRPARGDRLRVMIEDGDSPPLDAVRLQAAVRRPALIFSLEPGEQGAPAGRVLFGGGRAFRPQYDLAGLMPALPATGEAARTAEQLHDPGLLGAARLAAAVPNPAFDPAPALAFAMRPGAALDPRRYSHRQRITARPSPEGLTSFRLGPEGLALARPDLADLRIADADSHQWAYLLEREAATEARSLEVRGPKTDRGVSRYDLVLPVEPATLDQVVLETPLPFFDRAFKLTAEDDEGRDRRLAGGRLQRRIGDPRPLIVPVDAARVRSLELRVTDGDDAPLEFSRVQGRFPLPEVFLAAPAGEYTLLLGNPREEAPNYELERVRGVVLAVEDGRADTGAPEANPRFSAGARLAGSGGLQKVLLWAALAVAVVVLVLLTLRLARQGEG